MFIKLFNSIKQRLAPQSLDRELESAAVLYDQEVDAQFTRDGEEGSLAVLYEIIVREALKRAPAAGKALDIGCGSAQLLSRLAQAMPAMRFTGVDMSDAMLGFARLGLKQHKVENVRLEKRSWFELGELPRQSFDLITWNLAMHHCDTAADAARVIEDARQLLKPGGTLLVFDIVRPKSERLALWLAKTFNNKWGSAYFQNSLESYRAAFTFDEVEQILNQTSVGSCEHIQPRICNFWQLVALGSSQEVARPELPLNLPRVSQKMDYYFLKTVMPKRAA